jgi:hypothetical protein
MTCENVFPLFGVNIESRSCENARRAFSLQLVQESSILQVYFLLFNLVLNQQETCQTTAIPKYNNFKNLNKQQRYGPVNCSPTHDLSRLSMAFSTTDGLILGFD